MKLFKESLVFSGWLARLLRALLRIRFYLTLLVISAAGIALVAKVLAFVLPLKVILLAGSEGVPHYFSFFIAETHKDAWVLGLAVSAIVSYGLSVWLNTLTERWSVRGGQAVFLAANKMSLLNNQERLVQDYYRRITQLMAKVCFAALAFLLVSLLRPDVGLAVAGLCLAGLLFTAWAVRSLGAPQPKPLARFILNQYKNYIDILVTVVFLAGFLVVLAPYLLGKSPNILLALLAFVVLRQGLVNSGAALKEAIALSKAAHRVSALFLKKSQLTAKETSQQRSLRQVFNKQKRTQLVRESLLPALPANTSIQDLQVNWLDSRKKGVFHFRIYVTHADASKSVFLAQVFSPGHQTALQKEQFLFQYLSPESLWAAKQIAEFTQADFIGQIKTYGQGLRIAKASFTKARLAVLRQHLSVQPPLALVEAYRLSHPLMQDRLTLEWVSQIALAVDSEEEQKAIEQLGQRLPELCELVTAMPLYVCNPEIELKGLFRVDGVRFGVTHWGQWTLEPLGAGVPEDLSSAERDAVFQQAIKDHPNCPSWVQVEHLAIMALLYQAEQNLRRGHFNAALYRVVELNQLY